MAEPAHIEAFLRGVDAINRLDVEAALALTHPDGVFEPLRSQTEGAFIGEEGMRRFLADTADAFELFKATYTDLRDLGGAGAYACFCPTTERDLADGVGPAPELVAAGAGLTLGSDSHAVIDPFEEMRAVELDARLATQERGQLRAAELLAAGTSIGQQSLGFDQAGRIAAGCWADLVTVDLASPRTAGTGDAEESIVFAATPADVRHVVASGRRVDLDPEGVGARLAHAVDALTSH